MNKQPTSIDELYAFFVPNLIKPPSKSDAICSGISLDRAGWHVDIYHKHNNDAVHMWFYSHSNREPKWVVGYDKFKDPSQES